MFFVFLFDFSCLYNVSTIAFLRVYIFKLYVSYSRPTMLISLDTQLGKILPQGILSVLAQPIVSNANPASGETKAEGVILLASNASYAYSEKDRVWIRAVANKFRHV
jgi:hypothetical protein